MRCKWFEVTQSFFDFFPGKKNNKITKEWLKKRKRKIMFIYSFDANVSTPESSWSNWSILIMKLSICVISPDNSFKSSLIDVLHILIWSFVIKQSYQEEIQNWKAGKVQANNDTSWRMRVTSLIRELSWTDMFWATLTASSGFWGEIIE